MNTGDILYELYEPSTSRKFRDEIRDFTFQLVQNRLTFTACGFYDLNHTFVYSIIGSIATYLVILIQAEDRFKVLSNNTNHNSTSIRDFTLQLIQNPLSFTICGFFDLDYTLIRNVIATVTTYLVILIQIGNVPTEFFFENITLSTNNSGKIYD
ncbi:gustatory receptor for sugar taste 43a-like [Vespula maculifrons]|uniref:Gustatory receptor for sugar taste 43a-like n=1 Tax=Vespula maculifrons TaxID=7453 RepID=A0ABD2CNX2_VESMC